MKTVIMAGGKGTRIASVASDVPKPMIKICGKPILQHQIECLKRNGLTDITLVIGHLGSVIKDFFSDGKNFGVNISYYEETEPLGTAGALYKIPELCGKSASSGNYATENDTICNAEKFSASGKNTFASSGNSATGDFLLLCGDTIFDIDFCRLIEFHKKNNAAATLVTHPNGHPYDSSLIVTEMLPPEKGDIPHDSHRVIKWMNKEDERLWYKNRVNAGIEIISARLLEAAKKNLIATKGELPQKIDLDRDVLKPQVSSCKIFAYDTSEYIKDMGTPDRFYDTERDIKSGLVAGRNLSHKQKAIFLDRDGTVNREVSFLSDIEKMELLPGAAEAIKKINASGFLAIIITNQPVIARGEVSFEQLQEIHNKLETLLGKEGAYVDAIYFCPHHPHKGYDGEIAEYKIDCECRKPKAGMILQAAKDFNIDVAQSFMVGDRETDAECGKNAGCKKSVLVSDSYTLADFVEDEIL